jgi:hypothetical protein
MHGMKINAVIRHLRAKSGLGKLIIMNIKYLQLTAGLEEPVFMTTNNWLLHLREFLIQISRYGTEWRYNHYGR